jgi:hypothetical protein
MSLHVLKLSDAAFNSLSSQAVLRRFCDGLVTVFVSVKLKCRPTHIRGMVSSGILRPVALVRTDVSEKLSSSLIRVTIIGIFRTVRRLLVKASVVPSSSILVTLMKEALSSSETLVLTRATRRNIPEDTFLHSHRRENLKSYISM